MNRPATPSDRDLAATASQPTAVRWRIVALLLAFSFLSWFNRISMVVAYDERIAHDFHISEVEIGYVYSALLLAYTICMTPGGWFIDRFGAKWALAVMGFGSAVFAALTGAGGFLVGSAGALLLWLLVTRSLFGTFSAPIYPASGRVVSRWMPFHQRAGTNGSVTAAALVGIASTYVLFGALVDWFNWPTAFLIAGACTSLVALAWTVYATDRPAQHPSVNESERKLVVASEPEAVPDALAEATDPGWVSLLRNRSLVLLTLSYAAVGYFEYLAFFWMHYYFKDVRHLGTEESRYYAAILNLAMGVGMVAGGWLADHGVRRLGHRRGRAVVPVLGMLAGAVLLAAGAFAELPAASIAFFAVSMAAVGAVEGPFWTTAIELGGRRGGTSAAIVNTGGNALGLVAPVLTPWISQQLDWKWGISLGSVVCLLGVCLWWWIDPRERVEG